MQGFQISAFNEKNQKVDTYENKHSSNVSVDCADIFWMQQQ